MAKTLDISNINPTNNVFINTFFVIVFSLAFFQDVLSKGCKMNLESLLTHQSSKYLTINFFQVITQCRGYPSK